jgi:hypothetical protein
VGVCVEHQVSSVFVLGGGDGAVGCDKVGCIGVLMAMCRHNTWRFNTPMKPSLCMPFEVPVCVCVCVCVLVWG